MTLNFTGTQRCETWRSRLQSRMGLIFCLNIGNFAEYLLASNERILMKFFLDAWASWAGTKVQLVRF